jgi:hypothetical protein
VTRVVLDTNVLRAAVCSSSGASYRLVRELPRLPVRPLLSVPLYLEYQSVLTRPEQVAAGGGPGADAGIPAAPCSPGGTEADSQSSHSRGTAAGKADVC